MTVRMMPFRGLHRVQHSFNWLQSHKRLQEGLAYRNATIQLSRYLSTMRHPFLLKQEETCAASATAQSPAQTANKARQPNQIAASKQHLILHYPTTRRMAVRHIPNHRACSPRPFLQEKDDDEFAQ